MAKVLLVEDDNNLREIFEMRLQAEGYETLSASDGEEALVVATQKKPDLIIADVMMPKLSGFEMLETLRAAPEMADTKVIMMTALGQAEDRTRGEKLGVVKYLVKSQVTLEDFVRVVREVLPPSGQSQNSTDTADAQKNQGSSTTNNQESEMSMDDNQTPNPAAPAGDAPANPMGSDPAAAPAGDQQTMDQEQKVVDSQVNNFAASTPADPAAAPTADAPAGDSGPAAPAGDSSTFPPADPPADPVGGAPSDPAAPPPPAV